MACSSSVQNVDLLGLETPSYASPVFSLEPERTVDLRTVDLSGGNSVARRTCNFSGRGVGSISSATGCHDSWGSQSVEGNHGTVVHWNPLKIIRLLTSKPLRDVATETAPLVTRIPFYMNDLYTNFARRWLRPWGEFARLHPVHIFVNWREASQRGEIQAHIQQNVLTNVRHFFPNYAFLFFVVLVFYVCTSPMNLCMLILTGSGWSHALRDDDFKTRPWVLQVGRIQVPLGSNLKMLILVMPTLLLFHMFLGPLLWSAALCSGGLSAVHAVVRDGGDCRERFRHESSVSIEELP